MSLTLDDRVALEWLVYRLSVATDTRDLDAFRALSTPDAVWEGPLGRFEGADGLRRLVAALAASDALRRTRHWPANIVVDGDSAAGSATVTHDVLVVQATDEGPRLHSLSRSVATVLKADGAWRLARRVVTPHAAAV